MARRAARPTASWSLWWSCHHGATSKVRSRRRALEKPHQPHFVLGDAAVGIVQVADLHVTTRQHVECALLFATADLGQLLVGFAIGGLAAGHADHVDRATARHLMRDQATREQHLVVGVRHDHDRVQGRGCPRRGFGTQRLPQCLHLVTRTPSRRVDRVGSAAGADSSESGDAAGGRDLAHRSSADGELHMTAIAPLKGGSLPSRHGSSQSLLRAVPSWNRD